MDRYYNEQETASVAQKALGMLVPSDDGATVLCLEGDLGAGKTTLAKALAAAIGVTETVVSPTFVIAKLYDASGGTFDRLVHIDAYRIESPDELVPLRFDAMLRRPRTLVIVEWPERIRESVPKDALWLTITHHDDGRHITGARQ